MPLPATYARATLHFASTDTGAKANCSLYYLISAGTPPTLSTVATHASSFRTAFSTAVAAALPGSVSVTSVTLKYVAAGLEVEGDNTNGAIDGTVSGDVLPEDSCLVIQRRTGQVGRNKRGRIFWPFVPEAFQTDGELNTTGKAAAAGLAAMLKSNVVSGGTTYTPQTPNFKDSALVPIVQAGYVEQVVTRNDRRHPKILVSTRV